MRKPDFYPVISVPGDAPIPEGYALLSFVNGETLVFVQGIVDFDNLAEVLRQTADMVEASMIPVGGIQ